MRNLFLSAFAVMAVAIAPAAAADAAPAQANNATCACGKAVPADGKVSVTVKDGEKATVYKVCCEGCATNVKAMDPKEASKAFAAHNKAAEGGAKAGG